MPGWRVLLLAVACALSVANVYAQPLLDAMGREFGLDEAAVGMVVTATQIGCAVALLLVVPLGDLLDRRRLMIGQLVLLMLAWRRWPARRGRLAAGGHGRAGIAGHGHGAGSAGAVGGAGRARRGRVVGAAQGGW